MVEQIIYVHLPRIVKFKEHDNDATVTYKVLYTYVENNYLPQLNLWGMWSCRAISTLAPLEITTSPQRKNPQMHVLFDYFFDSAFLALFKAGSKDVTTSSCTVPPK